MEGRCVDARRQAAQGVRPPHALGLGHRGRATATQPGARPGCGGVGSPLPHDTRGGPCEASRAVRGQRATGSGQRETGHAAAPGSGAAGKQGGPARGRAKRAQGRGWRRADATQLRQSSRVGRSQSRVRGCTPAGAAPKSGLWRQGCTAAPSAQHGASQGAASEGLGVPSRPEKGKGYTVAPSEHTGPGASRVAAAGRGWPVQAPVGCTTAARRPAAGAQAVPAA